MESLEYRSLVPVRVNDGVPVIMSPGALCDYAHRVRAAGADILGVQVKGEWFSIMLNVPPSALSAWCETVVA